MSLIPRSTTVTSSFAIYSRSLRLPDLSLAIISATLPSLTVSLGPSSYEGMNCATAASLTSSLSAP